MKRLEEAGFPDVLPLLPIRDQVHFPHLMFPLLVGREKSVRGLEEAAAEPRHIFVVAQRELQAEDPDPDDIYAVGIVAQIMQVLARARRDRARDARRRDPCPHPEVCADGAVFPRSDRTAAGRGNQRSSRPRP